ncbi:MAG: hypothetical protein Q8P67_01015 [archaeon]|nr:hypothetical protein [archaeon]
MSPPKPAVPRSSEKPGQLRKEAAKRSIGNLPVSHVIPGLFDLEVDFTPPSTPRDQQHMAEDWSPPATPIDATPLVDCLPLEIVVTSQFMKPKQSTQSKPSTPSVCFSFFIRF